MRAADAWPGLEEAALYNLVVAHVYKSPTEGAGRAEPYAHELARRVLGARGAIVSGGDVGEREIRLGKAELASLMVYAGVLVRVHHEQVERFRKMLAPPALQPEATPEPTTKARLTWDQLLSAIDGDSADAPGAARAFDIVERYVRADPDAPARARYNAACFYASLSQHPALESKTARDEATVLAFADLRLALSDATLVPWAKEDPSLDPLRAHHATRWRRALKDREAVAPKAHDPPEGSD